MKARGEHILVSSKNNDPRDIVTDVDLKIDRFIKSKINTEFPGEKIYSEETADEVDLSESFWSIDPIDGTSNFARGIPHFAVVISWIKNGEPFAGAIYNPVTKELFSFEKSRGASLNGKPISVSKISNLKDTYTLLHIGRKKEIMNWGINLQKNLLEKAKKNINLGSSALDLAFLATGRVDAVIYGTITTVDIAVATALVRAAGGEVYGLDAFPTKLSRVPQQIIATCTKDLFNEISRL